MKLGNFKRIFKTDYATEVQATIEKLALTINNGFESLYNAMAKGISLSDNIACTVKKVTVKVDSSGSPLSTLSFSLDVKGQIKGISVIRADNLTNSSTYPTSTPFITFTQNDTIVTITNIVGLPANNNFEITLIAWN